MKIKKVIDVNMKLLFLATLLLNVSLSCAQKKDYDISINYKNEIEVISSKNIEKNIPQLEDTVHLYVENGFEKDKLTIIINQTTVVNFEVSTDRSLGLATHINLGKRGEVQNIGIRINGGKIAFVEIEREKNKISLNLTDDILQVDFLKNYPAYY